MSHQQCIGVQSLRAKLPVFRAGELHEGGNYHPANALKIHGHSIALFEVYPTRIGRCVLDELDQASQTCPAFQSGYAPGWWTSALLLCFMAEICVEHCKACRWPQLLQLLCLVAVFRAHWPIRCFRLGIRIMDPCFASVSRSFGQAPVSSNHSRGT